MTEAALSFAVLLPALLVAHNVADHWVQTSYQAATKGQRNMGGRIACAMHVAAYTVVTAATVFGLWLLFDLPVTWWGFAVGQVVSAATHYWADRRFTLQWLCDRLGKGRFYHFGAPREVTAWAEQDNNQRRTVTVEVYGDSSPGWDNPSLGTGAYALDQSWHWFWLGVAAVLTSIV